jgi:hypothetical protein
MRRIFDLEDEKMKDVNSLINIVLEENNNILFKTCTICERNLPCHKWFYNKHKNGKYGLDSKCKECGSRNKGQNYKFTNVLNIPWYFGKEDDFKKYFRIMSEDELSKHYNVKKQDIINLINKLKLKMSDVINSLTKDELIYIYNSVRNGLKANFPNAIFGVHEYKLILLKYLIDDILNWNRKDICNNYSTKILKQYHLGSLIATGKIRDSFEILNQTFPTYNLKRWELKNSSVGNNFWNDKTVSEALQWFKNILVIDKNIHNIYDAKKIGLKILLEEYNFLGMCNVKFKSNYINFFEKLYNVIYNKDIYLEDNFNFKIDKYNVNKEFGGIIYQITDKYNQLDDYGKTLINNIIKFCENEKRFPCEKDLSKKNGYIARTQYYKYFGTESITSVYDYITFVEKEKPSKIRCIKCGVEKNFTEEYFTKSKYQRYGLKYICRDCDNKYSCRNAYKNKGIIFNKFEDISPEQWWEYLFIGKIGYLPEYCLEEQNMIKIIRYVSFNYLYLKTKNEICDDSTLKIDILKKYNIYHLYLKFNGKLDFYQKCFYDFDIRPEELSRLSYSNDSINSIITNWIKENNLTIKDLLKKGITQKFNNKMDSMISATFKSKYDMFLWYFKFNNILHPITSEIIIITDFEEMPSNFWINKENRISYVKCYCEQNGINNVLHNTLLLKKWIYNNFKAESDGMINSLSKYTSSLYNTLIEAYPEILDNKILFDWEWTQFNISDKNTLIRVMREFILYRLNHLIKDFKTDIPLYINNNYIDLYCSKLKHHIMKNRFKNYYEWCCLSFPEYNDYWCLDDFEDKAILGNILFGSNKEKSLYEYIKNIFGLNYIKAIGNKRSGKYVFILPEESEDNKYCPDYVIEYINIDNKKVLLEKPIYIEYYGFYNPLNVNEIFVKYYEKTIRKNNYYKNNSSIYFIDFYPEDLDNIFKNVNIKLDILLNNIYDIYNEDKFIINNVSGF